MLNSIKKSPRILFLIKVFCSFFVYLMIGFILSIFIKDSITVTLVTNLMGIALLFYSKFLNVTVEEKEPKEFQKVLLLLLSVVFVYEICTTFAMWYYNLYGDVASDIRSAAIVDNVVVYAILSIIVAPVFEELLMRRVIYIGAKQVFNMPVAMILSSVIFALLHGTVIHMFIGTVFGIYMCILYEYTGKIQYPIIAHVLYNILSLFG